MTNEHLDEKYKVLTEELKNCEHVLIHINPKNPTVIVPEHLKTDRSLTLKISYNFAGVVSVDKKEVTANLSFAGKFFECIIPLESVWGCTTDDGKNHLWPEEVDPDSYSSVAQKVFSIKGNQSVKSEQSTRGEQKLTSIGNKTTTGKDNEKSDSKIGDDNPPKTSGPNLKLIK